MTFYKPSEHMLLSWSETMHHACHSHTQLSVLTTPAHTHSSAQQSLAAFTPELTLTIKPPTIRLDSSHTHLAGSLFFCLLSCIHLFSAPTPCPQVVFPLDFESCLLSGLTLVFLLNCLDFWPLCFCELFCVALAFGFLFLA